MKRQRTGYVTDTRRITPNMQRITLGGPDMVDFPPGQDSAYVKLAFPTAEAPGQHVLRSYTICHYNEARAELVLEFVVHGDSGPATRWAQRARVGDAIDIHGPGPAKLAAPGADWYLFAGDLSALPAIAANLEQLPGDARGVAFIETLAATDERRLPHPRGVDLVWLPNSDSRLGEESPLVRAVTGYQWPAGSPYAWIAGEFDSVIALRKLMRARGVGRDSMYASSYWQFGASDENHRKAKRLNRAA